MPPKKTFAGDSKGSSAASSTGATNSLKGKGKASTNSSGTSTPTNTSSSKKSRSNGKATIEDEESTPKVPTAREIIGGMSWTGKLPQTLFYELTVKEQWGKPEYTMRSGREGFQSSAIVRNTNPKTKEVEEIRFEIPYRTKTLPSHFPTALEARHYAATYALFRVSSHKNVHLMLPPNYREYWSEFQVLKKTDEEKNLGWKYNADPFLTQREMNAVESEKAILKAKREAASPAMLASTKVGIAPKGWENVPTVEMGQRTRSEVENLVRLNHIWNPSNTIMGYEQAKETTGQLEKLGFRSSHVEEACGWTSNTEEALEWLLVHVPEDDLPSQFLPDNYKAGAFAFVPESLSQEYAAKRLSLAGYSIELARLALSIHGNDEARAAESLMRMLLQDLEKPPFLEEDLLSFENLDLVDEWNEEQESTSAIFGERFHKANDKMCKIQLDIKAPNVPKVVSLEIRKPYSGNYPEQIPIMTVLSEPLLPAYVRLSLIRQMAQHAQSLKGQAMIFDVIDWVENNLARIIDNPGKLHTVSAVIAGKEDLPKKDIQKGKVARRQKKVIDWTPGSKDSMDILEKSHRRMQSLDQKKMLEARKTLPAWKVKNEIVESINKHQVTIISGETGSGKSTQSVQYVLDDLISRELGSAAKIVCTQPRRISALGLADRVSSERCSSVGKEVGYAIRGESKIEKDTKIVFMTTGVLLRQLQSGQGLEDITHVFVDEVHERSLDTDFLLVLLKRIMTAREDLRIILMSATLNADSFSTYFGGAQIIYIEGRTFPVHDFYLDDVLKATEFDAHANAVRAKPVDQETEGMDPTIGAAIRALGPAINYDLISETVEYIDRDLGPLDGAILIFLPGTMEISRAIKAINYSSRSSHFHVLPLHASLTPSEQRQVFPRAPMGKRKVICATNVAETSITIEDVVCVIDTGKVKETSYDAQTGMIRLAETWASRAACKQRRGRAGRVRVGNCYKLYTRHMETNKMQERPDPEILRTPLENLCLSVKFMGVKDVRTFLQSALTPPDATAVESALISLQKIGALDEDGLTGLGRHMASIPADLRCAKLMIYGAMFGCVNAALTIASVLTGRSPFFSPVEKRDESKAARSSFAPENGDLLADFRAYEQWITFKKDHSSGEVRRWCDSNYLAPNILQDISSNVSQYISALQETGFLPVNYKKTDDSSSLNSQNNNDVIIRAVIAAAFSTQIARIGMPEKKYASTMSGAKEMDPEARTIKYYTQEDGRLFLHPSTTLFDAQSFVGNSRFLAYVTKISTGKLYIRDLTPANSYTILLFGGKLKLDTFGRGLMVDGWLRIRGYPRIGCLINKLRLMLDELLVKKIDDPGLDIQSSDVVKCAKRLIERDGMDAP